MMNSFTFEIMAFGALLLAYFVLYYLSDSIIKIELQKKKTKRISNCKTYKTITRRGENFEYEFPLNPNLDKFWLRLLAKILDYGCYLSLFYLINTMLIEKSPSPFLLAFLALFLINPILESLLGKTFGKYLFGMRVIDDYGENPSLLTCFIKNILQLFSIIFYTLSSATILEDEMFFHNKRTFTYTIWNKDHDKIVSELKK
ncbi:RDD family protein [Cellulophaga sp. HaHa_2_1]|uniref:RDD family protein n=1 Tax=Cellulophaga sp. HaHa_2_1 TaxID=2749994 RepID=UPI001C4E89C3|nr:RDD family protein [Cellulophaga sp. HaHa_2_1]QXP52849.1 RDD family protein [Cellulophaga sp. HaHa_2_1]